jgi:hypothetical protein
MSEGPRRWIDDPEAPGLPREQLRRALAVEPPVYDVEAGLARFEAAGVAASGGSGLAWVIGGVVGLAAAAGLGLALAPSVLEPVAVAPPPVAEPDRPAEPAAAVAEPPLPPPAVVPPASAEPEDAASPAPRRSTGTTRRPAAAVPAEAAGDDAARREIEALARARTALAADPARALELVEAADREFSPGLFAEERAAIRVLALAQLGRRDEALRHGRAFLRRFPASTLADRVRGAIGD